MMAHICDPSTREAERGGSRVQGQPGLHSETMFQNKTKQIKQYFKRKKDILSLIAKKKLAGGQVTESSIEYRNRVFFFKV
jgi:hypothetical protein